MNQYNLVDLVVNTDTTKHLYAKIRTHSTFYFVFRFKRAKHSKKAYGDNEDDYLCLSKNSMLRMGEIKRDSEPLLNWCFAVVLVLVAGFPFKPLPPPVHPVSTAHPLGRINNERASMTPCTLKPLTGPTSRCDGYRRTTLMYSSSTVDGSGWMDGLQGNGGQCQCQGD